MSDFKMPVVYTCCICGQRHEGWGNNPWPINNDPNARCCHACNYAHVIPARIKELEDIKQNNIKHV